MECAEERVNPAFLKKAEALTPKLIETAVFPLRLVHIIPHAGDFLAEPAAPISALEGMPLGRGDKVCLDFGDHQVGFVSLRLVPVDGLPDAPAYFKVKFGEIPYEIAADSAAYSGGISKSWIQEEYLHVDVLPAVIHMPRRYAFRYLELSVIDTSPNYRICLSDVRCRSVSSADRSAVAPLRTADPEWIRMDQVSLKTMQDCMQLVFEDGPKRDRRLWIGDLRLQALTNYETFRNNDLVKRCLYLFAGRTLKEGRVGACLFLEPEPRVSDTVLFDYSLFFVSCLYDYYNATGDRETLTELYPTACRQIELALRELDGNGVVTDRDTWWCFLDWADGLNKQAGAQAVLIYTLRQAKSLAEHMGDTVRAEAYDTRIREVTAGALAHLWNPEQGFFVSGRERQVSWASQIWFVLAGVFGQEENARLLERLEAVNPPVRMATPYLYHHFIEALLQSGKREAAAAHMRAYWGGMLRDGADTFFELYDPADKYASPYGSRMINSFCHAWSGTPAYFIRKYFSDPIPE